MYQIFSKHLWEKLPSAYYTNGLNVSVKTMLTSEKDESEKYHLNVSDF